MTSGAALDMQVQAQEHSDFDVLGVAKGTIFLTNMVFSDIN